MLLERDAQLAVVRAALLEASVGSSALILLSGQLGIGRSALLQELPACASGELYVLRANAAPMEQDFAFGVVRQLFDSLLTLAGEATRERWLRGAGRARVVFADDVLPGADVLPGGDDVLPGGGAVEALPGGVEAVAGEAVLHDLRELLAQVSADRPLLLLVDDLHWADTASLRWLAYLGKRLHGLRVVLVCTLRDGDPRARDPLVREVADSSTQVLRPAALSATATAQLVREQFGQAGEAEFVRACHETSGGNPLFLRSVLLGMAVSGFSPTAEQADTARSLRPHQLRERLAGCLRTQEQPVRDLAMAIATLGEQGDPALIACLARLDRIGCAGALRVLHELGLLADEHTPRFIHRVVQDAVESSMTVAEHQHWHDAAASLLYETGQPTEQVAAQLLAVATSGRPWSAAVLRSAADVALRRGAPDVAARYLRRALLDSAEQGEERARLLIDLATAERSFDPVAGERHLSQAIALLGTAGQRAGAALRISPGFLGTITPSGVDLLRQAAEELDATGPLEGAERELALRLEARLRHAAGADSAELAAAIERLHGLGPQPPVCSGAQRELLAVLLNAATLHGGLPAAEVARQAERVLEREPATAVRAHTVLPLLVLSLVGADALGAIGCWLAVEEETRRQSGSTADVLVHAEHALVLLAQGRLTAAREHAERSFELARADWQEAGGIAIAALAAVAMEVRDQSFSERVLAHVGRRPVNPVAGTMLRLLQGALWAQQGRFTEALETVLACGRQLEAWGWHNPALFPWRPWAVSLYQRLGDARSALVLAEEEYARAALWGAPAALGRALRLCGGLRGGAVGTELLREAVSVLRGSANELELARALRALGRLLGEGAEAQAALREAGALARGCAAPWPLEWVGPGGDGTPRAAREAVLTPTESKVAGLVSRGLTNQEIAGELGVSSRAVEKHLTNSYRKLGISGRRQLVGVWNGTEEAGGGRP
ncbi:ATP-binding protein [Kitasatospora kifunensis]|uniref:DNA-binding CsgD family transcriptional regulator n=1 Tax=Kitasatospora kifunensis TaxID=58351 RepID=A0A7W7R8L6_KITKI|nr:AAA family ATPase [Kitasatospora kifunensis]MBB4927438.1 DNA-binding CsgD family transcriptional regulator [Kitasatospora kifunensis]